MLNLTDLPAKLHEIGTLLRNESSLCHPAQNEIMLKIHDFAHSVLLKISVQVIEKNLHYYYQYKVEFRLSETDAKREEQIKEVLKHHSIFNLLETEKIFSRQ